jgi:hypothetical protein
MSGPNWEFFELKCGKASAMFSNSLATLKIVSGVEDVAEVSVEDCTNLISLLKDIRTTLLGYPIPTKTKVPYSEPADDVGG